jgi:DUF2911 family protein
MCRTSCRTPRRTSIAVAVLVALAASTGAAWAQTGPPRLSPKATVSQVVGLTEIALTYSSPEVKGRKIWGGVVPYGQVWRTGANEATTFAVSTDVAIEGKPLAAGKYALFTIPNTDHWTLIFSKDADMWGAFKYEQTHDVLRVDVKPVQSNLQERLQFLFPEHGETSAEVMLRWEEVAVPFTVTVDTPKIALARAEEELAGDPKPSALISWARWMTDHGLVADKSLAWVQKATATEAGAKSYWGKAVEARLLAKAGRVEEAKKAAAAAFPLVASAADAENVKADAEKLKTEMAGWGK